MSFLNTSNVQLHKSPFICPKGPLKAANVASFQETELLRPGEFIGFEIICVIHRKVAVKSKRKR